MLGVLKDAFRNNLVVPTRDVQHVMGEIMPGRVYPCAFLTQAEFEKLRLPGEARPVVVIRDLRDTLVSLYFSVRNTHPLIGAVGKWRWFLERFDQEHGLIYMIDFLHQAARIQRSWLEAGEPVMWLENFMSEPVGAFKRFFREFWRMDVPDSFLEQLANQHSFERYSGGRSPGQEDSNSHYRKGIHGDWRQHFTPKVLDKFKARYGDLLIMAGYEKDDSWNL